MSTLLEDCTAKEQRSVVPYLRANGLIARDIYKEMFPACDGKCLSRKAVHNWVEKISQGRSKVAGNAPPDAKVVETTVCCGFRRIGKAMRQVYQCWWRICREINVFPLSNITCFAFFIHL
jgi:hypothetical protein